MNGLIQKETEHFLPTPKRSRSTILEKLCGVERERRLRKKWEREREREWERDREKETTHKADMIEKFVKREDLQKRKRGKEQIKAQLKRDSNK